MESASLSNAHAKIRSRCAATPTISCGVYSRAVFNFTPAWYLCGVYFRAAIIRGNTVSVKLSVFEVEGI